MAARVIQITLRCVAAILWLVALLPLAVLAGSWLVVLALGGGALAVLLWKRPHARWIGLGALALWLMVLGWREALTPQLDRDWDPAVARLPTIAVDESARIVTIGDVRNFEWGPEGIRRERWVERRYALADLRGVELLVEPFPGSRLLAHTMLSFDFGDAGRIVLSIEARKERGERYGPIPGALNQFELAYCFVDERDALTTRAITLDRRLEAYPLRARPETLRPFLLDVLAAADELSRTPRFYHIIMDNCTTAWIRHADQSAGSDFGIGVDTILNGRVAPMCHRRGLLAMDGTFEEIRERCRIDDLVVRHADAPDFAARIRARRDAAPPDPVVASPHD